ncbi:tetratricopeptide repeat protein [Leptospira sp. 'Mane']|uniref:tetratricopeptide repeat protein n=1 Tax=Leptospira sp. 'Mane' TaxID=3387407 RepID=UPI00398A7B33
MRKILFFLIFILLFGFFGLASQSIVGVKLQELRFGILRDQLMNYELSSQTLRERLKQMFLSKDDYLQEVKVNILESGIMNSETKGLELEMSPQDKFGLVVINVVRALNFKPFLELEEQQKTIIRLQFAFYMERTRKFSISSKKYEELEELLEGSSSDELAFTLLHNGYCLVMMGEREHAYVKLRKAIDIFPGTHYAENAELLISFLQEGDKRKQDLKTSNKKPEELAYSLFQAGDYEETLKTLESLPKLNNDQSYIKARSMEELGKTSNAVKEYIQLVKQKENKEVAIRANRRLLLIGNFYQENKSLVEFSKGEAEKLGDDKAAKQIEEGKSLVLKPIIVEKILKAETGKEGTEEAKELAEIKDNLKESLEESKVETKKLLTVVEEEKIPIIKEEVPIEEKKEVKPVEVAKIEKRKLPNLSAVKPEEKGKLQVRLTDGRTITCDSLRTDGKIARLKLGDFSLELPIELISSIITTVPKTSTGLLVEDKGGNSTIFDKLERNKNGEWFSSKKLESKIQDSELKEVKIN